MKARWFGANLEIHGLKQIVSLLFRRHQLGHVCYRRQPGKYVLNLKFTAFDPLRKFGSEFSMTEVGATSDFEQSPSLSKREQGLVRSTGTALAWIGRTTSFDSVAGKAKS